MAITKRDMKALKKLCTTGFVVVVCIAFFIYFITGLKKFSGEKEITDKQIYITAKFLNSTLNEKIELNAGDVLNLEVFKNAGHLKMTIIKENGDGDNDEIYNSDNVISSTFSVTAIESGTYDVTITGKRMKGKILIDKEKTEEEMQDEARMNKIYSNNE